MNLINSGILNTSQIKTFNYKQYPMAIEFIHILPLIGVLLGWGLTQLTNFFNIYLSDKRTLRETLYFLLELRYQISTKKSIEDSVDAYFKIAISKFPNVNTNNEEKEQAHYFIKQMITDFYNPRIEDELQELNENYDKCLLKFATVDPISAYKLKGKHKIISNLNQWNNYASETIASEASVSSDPKAIQFTSQLLREVELGLINDTIEDLKEIIQIVVDRIGGKTQKDFKKGITVDPSKTQIEVDERRIKKYFEEVVMPTFQKTWER